MSQLHVNAETAQELAGWLQAVALGGEVVAFKCLGGDSYGKFLDNNTCEMTQRPSNIPGLGLPTNGDSFKRGSSRGF